jgi:hypothetical protein
VSRAGPASGRWPRTAPRSTPRAPAPGSACGGGHTERRVSCHLSWSPNPARRAPPHLAHASSGRWSEAQRTWCMAASVMKPEEKAAVRLNDASPAAVHVT